MHFDPDIRNYYEQLVIDYFNTLSSSVDHDIDFVTDIYCMALNKLPARYIRHDVDMAFYLSSTQRAEMSKAVKVAVEQSLEYLLKKNVKSKANVQ